MLKFLATSYEFPLPMGINGIYKKSFLINAKVLLWSVSFTAEVYVDLNRRVIGLKLV